MPRDEDPELHLHAAAVRGQARGQLDAAELSVDHALAAIVRAVAGGMAVDVLQPIAAQAEELRGTVALLAHELRETDARVEAHLATDRPDGDAAAALDRLGAVGEGGLVAHDAATSLRHRLPQEYADPLVLEPGAAASGSVPVDEWRAEFDRSLADLAALIAEHRVDREPT